MEIYKIIAIPIIGFIIGYLTNYLAIKMLFHPKKRFLGFQGVIPKRRKQLAKKLSSTSVEILPSEIKAIEKIPILGKKAIRYYQSSVENKINSLSLDELEILTKKVVKKELIAITWIGGFIGFFIGLLQVIIIIYF